DDIIAVAPHAGAIAVVLKAVGLRETHDVEPVLRPTLGVVRGGEQTIYQAFIGVRTLIFFESRDFFWRGRQAGEIEGEPANERGTIRLRRRFESLGKQFLENEVVDAGARPAGQATRDNGNRGHAPWPERPVRVRGQYR